MTPREALAASAYLHGVDCEGYGCLCSQRALSNLADFGFEIVPTALVDAVLAADSLPLSLGLAGARQALAAYRAPVLLGQTEDAEP